jgi:hypothetical protein
LIRGWNPVRVKKTRQKKIYNDKKSKNDRQQERVMRQTISGLIAVMAVVAAGTVPASACGLVETGCGAVVVAPVYSGCDPCGGWSYERLPDPDVQYGYSSAPVHQYYYADQGPTYTGPGDFAPRRVYQEGAIGVWSAYRHPYRYGYHPHMYRYHRGYAPMPRVYYAHPSMRYGYRGAPRVYGHAAPMMRRHY